jgi:putative transposase
VLVNTQATQHHWVVISATVASDVHVIILPDQAGWHTTDKLKVPDNLPLVCIPAATSELNPAENVWPYLRQTVLGNRVFKDTDASIKRVC